MGGDCAVIRRRGGSSWFFNGTLGWDKENADIDHTSTVLNTQINIHDDDWWEVASLAKWKRRHSIREVPLATDITQKTFHQKGNFSPKNHCYRRRHNRKSKKDRIFPWLGFLNPSLIIWISLGADHRHHVKQNMDWWVRGGRKQQRRSKSWGRHNIWQTHRVQRTHADDGADDDNMIQDDSKPSEGQGNRSQPMMCICANCPLAPMQRSLIQWPSTIFLWEQGSSCYIQLLDFSPLCVFNWVLRVTLKKHVKKDGVSLYLQQPAFVRSNLPTFTEHKRPLHAQTPRYSHQDQHHLSSHQPQDELSSGCRILNATY